MTKILETLILPLGVMIFLVGLIGLNDWSDYHKLIHLFVTLPALALCLLKPRTIANTLKTKAGSILLVLFTIVLLSTIWNEKGTDDFSHIRYIIGILLFISAISFLHAANRNLLLYLLLTSAICWGISGLIDINQFYLIEGRHFNSRIIGGGGLRNPLLSTHIYGALTSFTVSYYFFTEKTTLRSLFFFTLFCSLLGFLLLTGSRTPLVALTAVFIYLGLESKERRNLVGLLVLATPAAIFVVSNIDLFLSRGTSYRLEIWNSLLTDISSKPWLGHGVGMKPEIEITSLSTIFSDPHNIHLGIIYNYGVIGLLSWLGLITMLFLASRNKHNTPSVKIAFAMLIYGIFAGLTEGGGFFTRPKEVWFITWLPIAWLLALNSHQDTSLDTTNSTMQ